MHPRTVPYAVDSSVSGYVGITRLGSGLRSGLGGSSSGHAGKPSARATRPQQRNVCAHAQYKYVASMGEALYDCLADQLGVPKEQVETWTPYPGGAPANVACALAQLGNSVLFLSAIGTDTLGQQFCDLLSERGVDLSAVQHVPQPTRDVLVVRSLDGDREFSGFGKADTTAYADCFVDASKLPMDKIQDASVLITGTLGLAYTATAEAMRAAVAVAKKGTGLVIIDVNWRPVFWSDTKAAVGIIQEYIQAADILKVTDEEAEWLLGIPAATALQTPEAVLAACPNARGVLVSAGEKGSSYAWRGTAGKADASGIVPVFSVNVVDTTGAGDAYLAGFVHKLLEDPGVAAGNAESLKEAVYFATACGAFTTTGAGAIAAQPTLTQAEALLAAERAGKEA